MKTKKDKAGTEKNIGTVRRQQSRSLATRNKILKGATEEFAAVGYDGATTRSIAERAKVQHGLLDYHFQTKLGIWHAVMEQAISNWNNDFMKRFEELRDCDVVTRLRELQADFIRTTAKSPELIWLLSHESGAGSERNEWLIEKFVGPAIELTVEMIREAQSLGRMIEGDPRHLHYLFLGAATRIFLIPNEVEQGFKESPFDEAFVERHIKLCQSLFYPNSPKEPIR